jgi:hypothetical protein
METIATTESQVSKLWPEIARATTTSERLRRIAGFLDCCETALQSSEHQTRFDVFIQISHLLSKRVCDSEVWDWLQEMAHSANLERQVDMRIAIFELVPDAPIIWSDLFRLWDMWFDPQARWAVYVAYRPFPRRVHQHLRRYIAHRKRHSLSMPDFSHEDFHSVLRSHAA